MSEPMTNERLAEIRAEKSNNYDERSRWKLGPQLWPERAVIAVEELLAEVESLRKLLDKRERPE